MLSKIVAQIQHPFEQNYIAKKHWLIAGGDYFANTNSLNVDFLNNFYQGQYISKSSKENATNDLKLYNQIGAELNAGITYRFKPDTLSNNSKLGYFVSVKNRIHFDALLRKDIVELMLYGNKRFAGTAVFGDRSNYNLVQYQQVQLGIIKTTNKKEVEVTYGLGLSLLNGQQGQHVRFKHAAMLTSIDGDRLDMSLDGEYNSTDSKNTGLGSSNGLGFSIDAWVDIPFLKREKRSERLIIEIRDIGMIWWNNKSRVAKIDSSYLYEGVNVPSIFDIQNTDLGGGSSDSIVDKILNLKDGKFYSSIPGTVQFQSISTWGKFQLVKGLRILFHANYRPNFFLNANYYFTPKIMAAVGVSYGGYSKVNTYLGAAFDFGKGYILQVHSNNIEGYILPKSAIGQGLSASFIKIF